MLLISQLNKYFKLFAGCIQFCLSIPRKDRTFENTQNGTSKLHFSRFPRPRIAYGQLVCHIYVAINQRAEKKLFLMHSGQLKEYANRFLFLHIPGKPTVYVKYVFHALHVIEFLLYPYPFIQFRVMVVVVEKIWVKTHVIPMQFCEIGFFPKQKNRT